MPNQLFYPKTVYAYKNSNADNLYLPSPRHQIVGNWTAGVGTAGTDIVVDAPDTTTSTGMTEGGCFVLNTTAGGLNYGAISAITGLKPDQIVTSAAIVAAGETYSVFYNKPDGAILFYFGTIDKNDVLDLDDAGLRNHPQYPFGKFAGPAAYNSWQTCVGFQVTRLNKNTVIDDPDHIFWVAYN